VTFASSSAELTPTSRASLDRVAESLREYPEVRVLVAGHTDSSGGDALNRALSQKRADAVRGYLVSAGVPPGQVEARGFGPSEPVADNRAPEGRARNRRVELRRL
jgi:outer membrane protein OmpA-like peptidoglycan-associated protein